MYFLVCLNNIHRIIVVKSLTLNYRHTLAAGFDILFYAAFFVQQIQFRARKTPYAILLFWLARNQSKKNGYDNKCFHHLFFNRKARPAKADRTKYAT